MGLFVLVILCMAMAMVRQDSLPEPVGNVLPDLGFDIIPMAKDVIWSNLSFFSTLADAWIFGCYVVFFFATWIAVKRYWQCKVRFLLCMSAVYAMRTLVLLSTRYPRIPSSLAAGAPPNYSNAPNTFLSALLVIFFVRTTYTDYMFSGHTAVLVMMSLFIWRYSDKNAYFVPWFMWALSITGIFLVVAVRLHYTADVLVGAFISALVFHGYHGLKEQRGWVQAVDMFFL
jgi:hypothetical protein